MNRLGQNLIGVFAFLTIAIMLGGCCHYGYQRGNPCRWPDSALDIGIFPTRGCNPCGQYDPCYPYVKSGTSGAAKSSTDWDYAESDYLTNAGGYTSGGGAAGSGSSF